MVTNTNYIKLCILLHVIDTGQVAQYFLSLQQVQIEVDGLSISHSVKNKN